MARTPLFRLLRRALRDARSGGSRPPVDRERRRVLAAGTGAMLALPLVGAGCGDKPLSASVAIVGGGLAGLHAAYRLKQRGLKATVFEASRRAGGRLFTDRTTFAAQAGQHAELGGELIDTSHMTMRDLAMELGIELYDYDSEARPALGGAAYFEGRVVPEAELLAGFGPVAAAVDQALAMARDGSAVATYRDDNGLGSFDQLSITGWLDQIGASGPARALLEVAYTIEFGLEASEQSALNLISMVSTDTQRLELFGSSDERFHAAVGSDAFTSKLAAALDPAQLVLEHRLVRVAQKADGRYQLAFETPSGTREVVADRVLLALPFTLLRDVDLGAVELPAVKKQAIAELGYGNNTKLMVGFSSRPWRTLGYDGSSYTDLGYQNSWETSRKQPGDEGILTAFTGGKASLLAGEGTVDKRRDEFLKQIDKVFPGTAGASSGVAARFAWATHPWSRGSYAAYKVGQWTAIAGSEFERVGNLHFAGEHTSLDALGCMEGAAITGAMAAEQIAMDLSLPLQAGARTIPARRIAARAQLTLTEGSWTQAMARAQRTARRGPPPPARTTARR